MRVIGWTVAALLGVVFLIYAVNTALALVSSPDDGAVLLGVAIIGVLVGAAIVGVMKGGQALKRAGLLAVLLMAVGCTTVPAGYVGVKVNQWGTEKGVEDLPLMTGRIAYNPISTDVYVFQHSTSASPGTLMTKATTTTGTSQSPSARLRTQASTWTSV